MNVRTPATWIATFALAAFCGAGYTRAGTGKTRTSDIDSGCSQAETAKPLTEENRLSIARDVSGEFVKVVRPIPAGKRGFELVCGKPIDEERLSDALRLFGTAAVPGDGVQITAIDFSRHQIRVEIDGGGKGHFNWPQHLQLSMGQYSTPSSASPPNRPTGGVLVLEFERVIPDLTPAQLMHDLTLFLDFSKRSASVNWIDTLSPAFRDAIQTASVIVGMDREMVIAAKGNPDKKVREWDGSGNETEDWIYGLPPSPSTFITFGGETVIRVEQYAIGGN